MGWVDLYEFTCPVLEGVLLMNLGTDQRARLGKLSTAHDIAVAPNGDILIAHLDGRAQLFSLE